MRVTTSDGSDALFRYTASMCRQTDVKRAVEQNHDHNSWWPPDIADWRLRMLVAGWSTRISNNMVSTYARVVSQAAAIGYDEMVELPSVHLRRLVAPLGLSEARLRYFYSLHEYLQKLDSVGCDPLSMNVDEFVEKFAANVDQAGFKVAQCAALYGRGYHCGVIPVDSGMVSKLGPRLGLHLPDGAIAHEVMRRYVETDLHRRATDYRILLGSAQYRVSIPDGATPSWWLHLVLIYSKRLYLNRPSPRLCRAIPTCSRILDCSCPATRHSS